MRRFFYFLILLYLTAGCQNQLGDQLNILKSESLSPEERLALLPNALFLAVMDQAGEQKLREIIDANGEYLLETNDNGDTPLGLAIQFYQLDSALFLAKQLDPNYYQHQNNQGESYLYLASQKGFVDLIQFLSNQFFIRGLDSGVFYDFLQLDLKTKEGERALHVAKNSAVAETLKEKAGKGGLLGRPFRRFIFLQNNKGQTFLHTAVRDKNDDLLRWGLEQQCSSHKNLSGLGSVAVYTWEGIQKFGKILWLDWDNLINTQDNKGLTALNFSANIQNLSALEILSSCPWNDYRLPDQEGNIPLQNFLLSLDPLKEKQDQKVKDQFLTLMQSEPLLSLSRGIAETIDLPNNQGDTSLHIAARLNDSFFYNELKKYGHIEIQNNEQKTAREIFNSKQKTLDL